jgi:hypothetical protein
LNSKKLRITIKPADDVGDNDYLCLEERCGKVWNVMNFFGGKLTHDQISALHNFSLAFGIDVVTLI